MDIIRNGIHGFYRVPTGTVLNLVPTGSTSSARATCSLAGQGPWLANGSPATIGPFAQFVEITVEVIAGHAGVEVTYGNSNSGGTVATNWQAVAAPGSNATPVSIDRSAGPNVMLTGVVDNIQVINVPSNMADGQEMQINLVGGGGSGSWTPWSSGAPATPGFVFLQGAAATAPALSSNYQPLYVKRRGVKYEVTTGLVATV